MNPTENPSTTEINSMKNKLITEENEQSKPMALQTMQENKGPVWTNQENYIESDYYDGGKNGHMSDSTQAKSPGKLKKSTLTKTVPKLNFEELSNMQPDELVEFFKNFQSHSSDLINMKSLLENPNLQLKRNKQNIYFGCIFNSQRHSKGIMVYSNGRYFQGQWENDYKHGKGYEVFPVGSIYQGQYINGKPEGVGTYNYSNGEVYEGQWVNGMKHGSGIWRGTKGDSYIGEWKFGRPDGYGVHTWVNGDRYEGQFQACLKHGQGTEQFTNGDAYVGNYINGKPEGYGEYYWANGSFYKGFFKNGLRHGHGIWKRNKGNSDCYDGEYVNDKKCGFGIFSWISGNVYKGHYFEDLRHGFGEMYWKDGSYYKGLWDRGIQHGEGEMCLPGRTPKRGLFENNVFVGESLPNGNEKQQAFNQRLNENNTPVSSYSNNVNANNNRVGYTSRGTRAHTQYSNTDNQNIFPVISQIIRNGRKNTSRPKIRSPVRESVDKHSGNFGDCKKCKNIFGTTLKNHQHVGGVSPPRLRRKYLDAAFERTPERKVRSPHDNHYDEDMNVFTQEKQPNHHLDFSEGNRLIDKNFFTRKGSYSKNELSDNRLKSANVTRKIHSGVADSFMYQRNRTPSVGRNSYRSQNYTVTNASLNSQIKGRTKDMFYPNGGQFNNF